MPILPGIYDIVVTMENAASQSDLNIVTTVKDRQPLTLTVIDTTTVASVSTVENGPTVPYQVGTPVTYTIQSRSANGDAQPTVTDTYTVTLTCVALKYGEPLCDDDVYTATATHTTGGLYAAVLTPTVGGNYSVLVTLDNDRRRNLDVVDYDTIDYDTNVVSDNLSLVMHDDTTVPRASTVEF